MDSDPQDISEYEALHIDIHEIVSRLNAIESRLDALVASHNEVGQNVAWMVANTQGIFQAFNSPEMMNQMMSMVGGGILGGRRQESAGQSNAE